MHIGEAARTSAAEIWSHKLRSALTLVGIVLGTTALVVMVSVIGGLAEAVRSGRIAEARIDASVRRILTAKARLNLHKNRLVDLDRIAAVVGRAEHKAILRSIADQSLTLVRNDGVTVEHGYTDYCWINPADIVVAQWVRMKCTFGCAEYGRNAS